MNKAVFLDRDGTVNEEQGYINHESRFKVFDFALEAIKLLNEVGYKIIIITNQSGLARGYFDESLLHKIHADLLDQAYKKSAKIDKIYYCPHHIDGSVKKYTIDCECRKPKPGMLLQAQKEYNISFEKSYLVGDRYKDIQLAQANSLKSILVTTGYGLGESVYQRKSWSTRPDFICENLFEAAQTILKNELRKNN